MKFYEEISKYYDYIFPTGKAQIKFLSKFIEESPKDVLDIACGTGGYSIELGKLGHKLTAVDLDEKMIEELKNKAIEENLQINAFCGNMLELSDNIKSQYDLAFCIGNSLVHLDGDKEIGMFLKDVKSILKKDGKLAIQIINYDRVLSQNVASLPTIENDEVGLKFKRIYRYNKDLNKVFFKTILEIEGKELENEIPLYPLLSHELVKLLHEAGYTEVKLYGDFKESEFQKDDSYALVIVAS